MNILIFLRQTTETASRRTNPFLLPRPRTAALHSVFIWLVYGRREPYFIVTKFRNSVLVLFADRIYDLHFETYLSVGWTALTLAERQRDIDTQTEAHQVETTEPKATDSDRFQFKTTIAIWKLAPLALQRRRRWVHSGWTIIACDTNEIPFVSLWETHQHIELRSLGQVCRWRILLENFHRIIIKFWFGCSLHLLVVAATSVEDTPSSSTDTVTMEP